MTQPSGPVNLSWPIKLAYSDRPYADPKAKVIPVSRTGAHQWATLPWDGEVRDPGGMHSMPGGWSILRAPADRDVAYSLTASLRVMGGLLGCSLHLMPVHCRPVLPGEMDGVDNILTYLEATETFVGANEDHTDPDGTVWYSNSHQQNTIQDVLPAGQLLRFVADYWNAPATAVPLKMVGATVSGFWGWAS